MGKSKRSWEQETRAARERERDRRETAMEYEIEKCQKLIKLDFMIVAGFYANNVKRTLVYAIH